mmetsp:Transcript_21900/g.49513  ORF Transcript_21900/g.49513 Transcript_21900/m.49513 type:complete len:281 (-) Transcript_21900:82-924(-)
MFGHEDSEPGDDGTVPAANLEHFSPGLGILQPKVGDRRGPVEFGAAVSAFEAEAELVRLEGDVVDLAVLEHAHNHLLVVLLRVVQLQDVSLCDGAADDEVLLGPRAQARGRTVPHALQRVTHALGRVVEGPDRLEDHGQGPRQVLHHVQRLHVRTAHAGRAIQRHDLRPDRDSAFVGGPFLDDHFHQRPLPGLGPVPGRVRLVEALQEHAELCFIREDDLVGFEPSGLEFQGCFLVQPIVAFNLLGSPAVPAFAPVTPRCPPDVQVLHRHHRFVVVRPAL